MASHYRRQVEQLHTALLDGDETNQIEAKEIIRSLIDAIILTPKAASTWRCAARSPAS
jgi:hypothetical protein